MSFEVCQAYELVQNAYEKERLAHAFLVSGAGSSEREELASRMIEMTKPMEVVKTEDGGMDLFGEEKEVVIEKPKSLEDQAGEYVRVLYPRSKGRRISVEEVRELERELNLSCPEKVTKVGVIVDADRMTEAASNAFLKTLEEPPQRVLLVLLTAFPERLLPTIRSRSLLLELRSGEEKRSKRQEEVWKHLEEIAKMDPGWVRAMAARTGFLKAIEKGRAEIQETVAQEVKEERAKYRDIAEAKWFAKREEIHQARAESEYLNLRLELTMTLLDWMGKVIQAKVGSENGGGLKGDDDLTDLLRRMDALLKLREYLETNVQEMLAYEVAFAKAFG